MHALSLTTLCLLAAHPPVGPRTREALPEVLHYDLQLSVNPETREISGSAGIELAARRGTLSEVRFALNNSFSLDEVREGTRKVRALAGKRIAEGKEWRVKLIPALEAGEKRVIHFEYHGKGVDPGAGDSDWMGIVLVRENEIRMSHQSQWYPIVPLDDRARAKLSAPTTLRLSLPRGMQSLGPGELIEIEKRKAIEIHHWNSEGPVRASLLAGTYEEQVVKAGKQRVRVLTFEGHERGGKRWAEEAARALETFRRLYGDLGKRTYGLAEMKVRNRKNSYNYEADGFSVYDSVLFDGRAADARKIAHEVAHLYFGDAIDAYGAGERFMTESMAEAAAFVHLEESEGEAAAIDAARLAGSRYLGNRGEESDLATADFTSPRYFEVVYGKGALALRLLRAWVGPAEFDKALRGYVEECRDGKQVPGLGSFLNAMQGEFGKPIDEWEDDWLRRSGFPQYSVVELERASAGGKRVRVGGWLEQEGELYHNPVELGMVSKNGKQTVIELRPRDKRLRFEAVVPHDVERVVIDPRCLVLIERD